MTNFVKTNISKKKKRRRNFIAHGSRTVDTFKFLYPHTAISINIVGSKHEAKRQDRKFTWDFYE